MAFRLNLTLTVHIRHVLTDNECYLVY